MAPLAPIAMKALLAYPPDSGVAGAEARQVDARRERPARREACPPRRDPFGLATP